jgi:transcriptional antiterminator RfaH
MSASMRRWFAVQTQPHAERKAAEQLMQQDFEVYLPRYLKRRRHARKVDVIAAPLFPRYLFVAIDTATQRWRAVGSTWGVTRLVCQGDQPAPVPPDVISALRAREDENGYVTLKLPAAFHAGDKVRLIRGAFTDCLGHFEMMSDCERVAVLLDMLGRKVRVLVDMGGIEAA